MSRLVLLALFANAAAVNLREGAASKLTPFEMGCYYEKAPDTEKGGDKGRSYRGLVTYTASGRTCQNWQDLGEESTPDEELSGGGMKWGNGLGNHNYCRNPDPKTMSKPWCFTMDSVHYKKITDANGTESRVLDKSKRKKEVCNIDPCPKDPVNYVQAADKLAKTMRSSATDPDICQCAADVRADLGITTTKMGAWADKRQWGVLNRDKADQRLWAGFLQHKQMGQTKDGRPCFCRH